MNGADKYNKLLAFVKSIATLEIDEDEGDFAGELYSFMEEAKSTLEELDEE